MFASTRHCRWAKSSTTHRCLAVFCGLLLLLPALGIRPVLSLQRATARELAEQSRPLNEEERSSEDALEARLGGRRQLERRKLGRIVCSHRCAMLGAQAAPVSCGFSFATASRSEMHLRNGCGASLRC